MVTFNLRRPSRTLDALLAAGVFRVHSLRATARGREVAHAFVEQAHGDAYATLEKGGIAVRYGDDSSGSTSIPEIVDEDGVLASLVCRVVPGLCVDVGDHTVVIAEVVGVPKQVEESGSGEQELGLLYAQQSYGKPDITSIAKHAEDVNDEDD
jgi:flavin reductase (DIM6/NTAB) family NADH-FMN oxidoreductase RutF